MCVILFKSEGASLATSTIEDCFRTNRDGAGFMWSDGSRVQIRKGYMTWKHLHAALAEEGFLDSTNLQVREECELAIHCRIATSGGVAPGRCHPFPIHKSYNVLNYTALQCNMALMHNGVITGLGGDDWSDTQEFVASFGYHVMHENITADELDKVLKDSEYTLYSSKFLLMTADKVYRVGSWTAEGGVFYSNLFFRNTNVSVTHRRPTGYVYRHGWQEADWEERQHSIEDDYRRVDVASPYGAVNIRMVDSCFESKNCANCRWFSYVNGWAQCEPWLGFKSSARRHMPHLSKYFAN